jgi:hypothetical protein
MDGTLPEPPHPLALDVTGAIPPGGRVLVVGIGSGRNLPPLLAAGLHVDAVEADAARAADAAARWSGKGVRVARARYGSGPIPFASGFDGALATHALLHGDPASIGAALAAVRDRLKPGAPFYFTLGSTRDPRFGAGTRIDAATWAPNDGDEAGVPHAYFDEPAARALLRGWTLDSLEERDAAATAGAWAHPGGHAGAHWFVRARRAAQ